jgi:LacI family transcriptional regulator, repressor for deo operon, udp, cdd, tsx, nupC, and nupG
MKNIGLVLVQPGPRVAHEPLISGISHGLEETFVRAGMRLVTRVVRERSAELDVYRYWHASGAVDAVVLVRVRHDDDRVRFLGQLKIPFAAIVDEVEVGDFSAVTVDSASMMRSALGYLTSRGYSNVVYVKAPEDTVLSDIRARRFVAEAETSHFRGRVVSAELTADGASAATRELMADADDRPDAIIFDDDVTAVAGLETIQSLGIAVPSEVAVIAWNDSVLCQSATPSITALSDQAHQIGTLAATCLIDSVATGAVTIVSASDSFIVQRASA